MKSTGIVRKFDELGRIVIPKETRKSMGIEDGIDSVEIFVEDDRIILKKYRPSCVFCSETEGMTMYKGRLICKDCISQLGQLL